MVKEFREEYFFLSNFYEVPVTYLGNTYRNSEAAFQSMKLYSPNERSQFTDLNPSEAKRLGRSVKLRSDWNNVREKHMRGIIKAKFEQNADLRDNLLSTGDEELIECNDWHDNVWGDCTCPQCKTCEGQNKLGKILMEIREELR